MREREIPRSEDITRLLNDWSCGDGRAQEELLPLVYADLRRLASRCLGRERRDHTLQPTALIHEAYLGLVRQNGVQWRCRSHFFAVSAMIMRRILVDYARSRAMSKRGGGTVRVDLQEADSVAREVSPRILDLDAGLDRLSELDPAQSRLVELRYFGGLSIEETAAVLGVTPRTVKRRWVTAKLWLLRFLNEREFDGDRELA